MKFDAAKAEARPFDWAGLGWLFLFFWYFSGVTQLLIQVTGTSGFTGFRQAFLLSGLWLIPVLLFPARTRVIAAGLGALLWLASLPAFGYFLIYGQEFSQSVIFILFESNVAEGSEYLTHYFAWWMVPAFLGYAAGAVLLWTRLRPVHLPRGKAMVVSLALLAALVGYPAVKQSLGNISFAAARDSFEKRMEPAVPWQLLVGFRQYRQQLAEMDDLLQGNARIAPLTNFKDANAGLPATLVLVIGESTNRQRMSLYGYPRETTPNLDRIRDQLDVFDNVITPRPYTIEALQQVLTFADEQNPNLYLTKPSLLNMMKQAGYKTYWITNQQTLTKRNTMLTTFSKQADEQFYLNNNRNQNARQYDDDVLPPFEKVLADPAPRKFIVVHLLGTHMSYQYRYPSEYERFTDRQGVPASVTDDQLPTYNSYDNAVLFNDHVVSSLIGRLSGSRANGFLLYLSDHGEAVFDPEHPQVLGRNEAAPTAPMYTIPFMLWRSSQWRAEHPQALGGSLDRPYSSSSFIHTWADLAGLRFDEFDPSRSVVNAAFQARPLLIGDPHQPKALIDFSLIKPKAKPRDLEVVSGARASASRKAPPG
ncbi:phosphoethanolamine transferase CptA [Pseudomonas sp. Q1-7]|uniref:phosphoethanolamine transferase CptA n=1 Tax=Pseudomonas sp. Q1-7 TaxID=3020843 RepID=UPI0023008587|nr:phosphoethanolamine transferase CptA [Pseudomonas sp. Q1-7]